MAATTTCRVCSTSSLAPDDARPASTPDYKIRIVAGRHGLVDGTRRSRISLLDLFNRHLDQLGQDRSINICKTFYIQHPLPILCFPRLAKTVANWSPAPHAR